MNLVTLLSHLRYQVLGLFLMPGVIVLIMIFSTQTQMAELYGIRGNEMGYYLAFAVVIIPFSLIMDVFVLNTQEVKSQSNRAIAMKDMKQHSEGLTLRRPLFVYRNRTGFPGSSGVR